LESDSVRLDFPMGREKVNRLVFPMGRREVIRLDFPMGREKVIMCLILATSIPQTETQIKQAIGKWIM